MSNQQISQQIIHQILDNPAKYAQKIPINRLVKLLETLSHYYYETSEPLIPDSLYDVIIHVLEERDPSNPFLVKTGVLPASLARVKLPYPMPSLDKIKADSNAIDRWKKKYGGPYVLSDKLDGISGQLYKNKKGKLELYTRGDSLNGKNISHLIPFIITNRYNLDAIPNDTSIRGEIIMKKINFQKIKHKYKNARNTIAGLVNAKHYSLQVAKLTDFVVYAIIHPLMKQSAQMTQLTKYKLHVVDYLVKKDVTNKILSTYLQKKRKDSIYDIDGIVVIDSSTEYKPTTAKPDYGFAFKMVLTDQTAETTVIDVKWTVSMYGYLKPTLQLEPIILPGVTITNASAFNAKYIVDNKLGPGAVVEIVRSGDVIPYILKVIKPSATGKPKMPDISYEWNKTNIDIIAKDIHGAAKDAKIIRNLDYFFKTMQIKYISIGILTKLVQHGYKSVYDILTANLEKLTEIDGIGQKLVDKIFDNIKNSFKGTNLYTLMAASNAFGRGFGRRRLKVITDSYPNILVSKQTTAELKDKIMKLMGFDHITAGQFANNLVNFKKFFNQLKKVDYINVKRFEKVIKPTKKITKNQPLLNQKIVFTGFRDKQLENNVVEKGGQISTAVSKNTTLLVYTETATQTAKYVKAVTLDIPLITIDEFKKKYNL